MVVSNGARICVYRSRAGCIVVTPLLAQSTLPPTRRLGCLGPSAAGCIGGRSGRNIGIGAE
eukprot:1463216-Pyramimonas_sp.AAC.1